MINGIDYQKLDDNGLHIRIEGQPQLLRVDTVMVCAEENDHCHHGGTPCVSCQCWRWLDRFRAVDNMFSFQLNAEATSETVKNGVTNRM